LAVLCVGEGKTSFYAFWNPFSKLMFDVGSNKVRFEKGFREAQPPISSMGTALSASFIKNVGFQEC
jgi:hypothetical protein